MPKISDEQVASRRRRILDASAVCFARDGLHRATVDDVATASGLSKGALYGYFKSKEDMVAALKVESVQRDASVIRAATQHREPEEALAAMLSGVVADASRDAGDALAAMLSGVVADASRDAGDALARTGMLLWGEALLSQRLLDAQLLETQLWADALELVVEEAQRLGHVSGGLDARAVAWTLGAVIYGASAIRSWDPQFDPGQVIDVVRALVAGRLGPNE